MVALNLPGIFGIAAAALALSLLVKIALSPANDPTGKALLLVFVAGLLGMAVNSLYFLFGLHLQWPHFSFLWIFLMAWIGPALWCYTARVLGLAVEPLAGRARWHWLPGIVLQLALLPYLLQSGAGKIATINNPDARWMFLGLYLFIYLQIAAYVLLCQRAMAGHRARIAQTEEKAELRTDLTWINVACYGFAGFVALDGIVPHLQLTPPGSAFSMAMALYFVIIATVFHASAHGRVYPFITAKTRADAKYSNSSLRDDTAQYYLGKLEQLMREQQPFLDSELSLDKLAAALKLHPHYLSQLLNDHVGKNYHDYINEQRIAHARGLLLAQPQLPIVEVAIACGYNNTNSFYNSFRRFVGMKPTEFRQQGGSNAAPSV